MSRCSGVSTRHHCVDILILKFIGDTLDVIVCSHMSYIKSKNRSQTDDAAVVDVIKCKRYAPVDASRDTPMHAATVNWREALEHKLSWE